MHPTPTSTGIKEVTLLPTWPRPWRVGYAQSAALGLGNLHAIAGVEPVANPAASFGRLQEVSAGKDSTTGHWELMGLVTDQAFPTYPDGFPPEVLSASPS